MIVKNLEKKRWPREIDYPEGEKHSFHLLLAPSMLGGHFFLECFLSRHVKEVLLLV